MIKKRICVRSRTDRKIFALMGACFVLCGAQPVLAAGEAKTPQEFAEQYMAAFNKKDKETLKRMHLYPKVKSDLQEMMDDLDDAQMASGLHYSKFELTPADPEMAKPTMGPNGRFYKPTLKPSYMLKLIGSDKNSTTSASFPIGQKDGIYYAVCAEPDNSETIPFKFGWQRFSAPKSNWSVLMPNEPEPGLAALEKQFGKTVIDDPDAYGVVRNTAGIKTTQHIFSCAEEGKRQDAADSKERYLASCTTYSDDTLKEWFSDVKKNLDEAVGSCRQLHGGKLVQQKDISLNEAPGKAFEIEGSDGAKVYGRVYWVKNALYKLVVECRKDPDIASIDKFLGSLEVQ